MKRPCPGDFPDRGVFVYQIKVSEQVGGEEQKRCGGYTVRAILVFADGSRTPTSPAVDGAILIFTNLAGMQAETGVDRAVLILADSVRVQAAATINRAVLVLADFARTPQSELQPVPR